MLRSPLIKTMFLLLKRHTEVIKQLNIYMFLFWFMLCIVLGYVVFLYMAFFYFLEKHLNS